MNKILDLLDKLPDAVFALVIIFATLSFVGLFGVTVYKIIGG